MIDCAGIAFSEVRFVNIFYLDHDVRVCAKSHLDKHVVKMILEYCQLLSTAHRVLDGNEINVISNSGRKKKVWSLPDHRDAVLYAATHINHPSAIWCRDSTGNYNWLHSLLVQLCAEYTHRYGKIHKCQQSGLVDQLGSCPNNIRHGQFTEVTPAMHDDVKLGNSIDSYRNYYINNKSKMASWKNREVPNWYVTA